MTPNEFKAWFDGFTEAMEGQPTEKQWDKIKERVSQIDGKPVTERIYLDYYWPRRRYLETWLSAEPEQQRICRGSRGADPLTTFDSNMAMYAAGQSDYSAV